MSGFYRSSPKCISSQKWLGLLFFTCMLIKKVEKQKTNTLLYGLIFKLIEKKMFMLLSQIIMPIIMKLKLDNKN